MVNIWTRQSIHSDESAACFYRLSGCSKVRSGHDDRVGKRNDVGRRGRGERGRGCQTNRFWHKTKKVNSKRKAREILMNAANCKESEINTSQN